MTPGVTNTDIEKRITEKWPDSQVEVKDLTGTSDHYQITIVTGAFEGQSRINQHRMVKEIFEEQITSGELHAISLKTLSPSERPKGE